ncbi:MAG: hypothetical protein K6F75_05820 [Butyrivibrio sp.]|nr:hypothetical protein [Butyrivibrio sp.]
MKKLVSKLLFTILAIVVAICGLIVACAIDPTIAKEVSAFAKSHNLHIEIKKSEEELAAEAAASAEAEAAQADADSEGPVAIADVASLSGISDAATAVSSFTYTQDKEKEYAEYLGDWSTKGIDKDIVDEKQEDPLVNEDIDEVDENGDQVTYYDNIDELTGYGLPERNVIKLEDQGQVQEALIDVGMGYSGNDYSFPAEFYPYYQMLDSNCKALYRQIYANALNMWPEFLPVNVATPSEWNNALLSVSFDHPELFWLNTRLYTEYDFGGKVVKVRLYFYDSELGDIDEAKSKFAAAAEPVVIMASALETNADKEQFIHDYLTNKLTYNENNLDQSAYSAIVNSETVCAGYSKAFQYLMQQVGIPTYFCVGWGGGLVSGGMHAWNIVNMDKKYANVDVTWDDRDPTIYEFYNRPDNDFHRHKRMFNSQYLPACR